MNVVSNYVKMMKENYQEAYGPEAKVYFAGEHDDKLMFVIVSDYFFTTDVDEHLVFYIASGVERMTDCMIAAHPADMNIPLPQGWPAWDQLVEA